MEKLAFFLRMRYYYICLQFIDYKSLTKGDTIMAMKSNLYVEFQGKQIDTKDVLAAAKKVWTGNGNKVKDLNTVDLYIKPEENAVYYVFNETESGKIEL